MFGTAGTVEKITARATLALDPADPHNAVIVDLDRAPRSNGRVEATTDVVILRPAHPNGTLVFEVANRGRKLLVGAAGDSDGTAGSRLERASDVGNGFLLEQGYTLVWAGWQGDTVPGMRIDTPVVPGVTGPSRDEFTFTDATQRRTTLSYPIADRASAQLTVRAHADDPRQPLPAPIFIDDSTIEIVRPATMPADALYELDYTARDPRVFGMGLAAIRDVVSFLRHGTAQNPIAGQTTHAIALGISQSGRVLRDALYFGMNQDEAGRQVFEGMFPLIPGARRSFTNARFAQPGRNPGPVFDRLYPVLAFPFTYPTLTDHLTGRTDGILARCTATATCPKIIQLDSEFEFWGSQASLITTDTRGAPIDMPANVRLFMLAGAPHSNPASAVVTRNPGCALPLNPVSNGPALRALLTALDAWITTGTEPPASRYPSRADRTLVPAAEVYAAPIPALGYHAQYVRAALIEPTAPLPTIRGTYPLFQPRAGRDGNAVSGLRLPLIAAARATYTGWNSIAGTEGEQDLCTQMGATLPLPATHSATDPRPALDELYPAPDSYVTAVRAAAAALVHDRLLLPADAAAMVTSAQSGTLDRLR